MKLRNAVAPNARHLLFALAGTVMALCFARALHSSEVAERGGVETGEPPAIVHVSSVHRSSRLEITAIGSGLSAARSMSLQALDSSWALPLTITARCDGSVTGVASVAALLPACRITAGFEGGAVVAGAMAADEEPPLAPQSCLAQFFEDLLPRPPGEFYAIQPREFAIARGFVDSSSNRYALHLFYTRRSRYIMPGDSNEKTIGHAWTTDFSDWQPTPVDTAALAVRPERFDELHVWAPSIVQRGPTFYMFYAGVREENGRNHQCIGLATSTDLNTWTPADAPVLTVPQVPWAKKDPADYDGQQLRDPFVMADPVNPGQWLMYIVAVDSLRYPKMAVGVARSLGDFSTWTADDHPLRGTQKPTYLGTTTVVESPHVFPRNGQWWLLYTVNDAQVFFETTASADPTDTTIVNWTDPIQLWSVAEGLEPLQSWRATEHLRIGSTEYLAAWHEFVSSIDINTVYLPSDAVVDSFLLSCPQIAGTSPREGDVNGVRMVVSSLRAGATDVGVRLELASRMPVRLTVHDIVGRRRATLLDGELPAGVTDVTWDGRDWTGQPMASGMYFVRLAYASGVQFSKLVMLR